uniref:Carboxypeptidase activation peptide domain-containing protein n=1 Tax=Glossina pallidipes TaxID=7398 RepID=A0A1A9Z661_GLOPL
MSVDRFALNHNEIQQINDKRLDYNDVIPESESILYDNMQYVPAIDQNGQSDLYVLVPTDNGDDEEIVSNFLGHDHAAIPGNGKVEDMLMLESEDAPTVQIYKLTNKSTENERIIEDHPENHDNSESLKDELTAPKVTELPILNSNEHFEDYKADVLSETVKEIQHELESELLNYEPLNENPQNYQLEALDNANSQAPSLDQTKAEGANTEFIKNDENEDEDKVDQPMIGVAQEEGPTDVSDEIEKTDTMRDNPELAEASSYLNEANTESAIKSEDIPKNSADLVELEKEVQIENRDESLNLNDGENGPVTETLDAQHQDNEAVIEISETSKNIENSLVKDESLENFAEKDTISHLTGMVEEAVQISDNLHSNEKATEPLTDQIESHAVDENEATESQPGGVVMEEEISKETKMNEKMNSATNDSKNVEDDTLTTNKDQFKVEDSKFVVASESKQTENLLQQFDELNAQAIREDNESIFTPEELEDGIEEKLSENDEMQNMPINDEKANANHTMLTVIIQAPQTPTTETPATSFDHDDVVSASDTQDELLAMIAISTSTSKPLHVMDGVLNYANSTFINQQQATESTEVVFGSKLRRYDGAQVWRIVVQNDREKKLADELQTKYVHFKQQKTATTNRKVLAFSYLEPITLAGGQLWKEVKQEVDYLLKPQVLADAERHVRIANLTRIVLIDNLQNVIEVENPPAEQIAQLQNRKAHT